MFLTNCGKWYVMGGRMKELGPYGGPPKAWDWRRVLKEYHANAGRRVPVTLPKLKCLEDRDEVRERAA